MMGTAIPAAAAAAAAAPLDFSGICLGIRHSTTPSRPRSTGPGPARRRRRCLMTWTTRQTSPGCRTRELI
eukprot:1695150-Rhodomonas_salina.1